MKKVGTFFFVVSTLNYLWLAKKKDQTKSVNFSCFSDRFKAIRKSLTDMSQKFAAKVILGLNQPISCSKVLPPGVFLSQTFACKPKVRLTLASQ